MENGQIRTLIEDIRPQVNGGEFPVRRVVGQEVIVEADICSDGHEWQRAFLLYKHRRERKWKNTEMSSPYEHHYQSSFPVEKQGIYEYKISAGIDRAYTWRYGLRRKAEAGQDVSVELLDGIPFLEDVMKDASGEELAFLKKVKRAFAGKAQERAVELALSDRLDAIFTKYPHCPHPAESEPLEVYVDRKRALFSSWYEFFPRSASADPGRHGTFRDCQRLIPKIVDLGFDTIYFPPIHPIGEKNRKGKNNAVKAGKGDVGSPWAIGSRLGGHKAIHPELGTLEDFRELIREAAKHDIEIALDIAFQCAPDHPWVAEHPQWFKWRADGTVQYAENPPKKYQDILPIYFETGDWKNLWKELTSVVLYWVEQGVKMFRVDNPHTKPFRFWKYLIEEVRKKDHDVIFLSEAFTSPRIMHALAKVGFTQSYTYYTWRNSKHEMVEYMEELTHGPGSEYFRPNFWPNTPDINPWNLQGGSESLFLSRYFMAATLSSNYGMYGPVYQQMIHEAVPAKEEYLHSEKYELKHWDWGLKNKLTYLIRTVNKARAENPALQQTNNYQHCLIENDNLYAYYKWDNKADNHLLMVVNMDPYHRQEGWVQMPLHQIGVSEGHQLRMFDLLSGNSYLWDREYNYVALEPAFPFHLFLIKR